MPRGRPKNLSIYERGKANKFRTILSEQGIRKFDQMNDATLLKTVYIDPSGTIFIAHEYFENSINTIEKLVKGYTE